jgi:hypothetical protein
MPGKVFYLTLSHRWGNHQFIKLLQAYVDGFQRDIPWWQLPKTFQDAITITRHLGFSYIWIDSLCIIQDSKEDWNHEAKLMGKIYMNAQCNIAASDAPDSRAGCFNWRDPRAIQPEPVDFDTAEESYIFNETDIYGEHGEHGLYTRGWVLQEALLARRTLDCARGQLFWRCSEMRASEVFPGGVPTNIYHDDHPASKFKAISADDDQVILNANIIDKRLQSYKTRSQIPRAPGKGSLQQYTDAPFAFWLAIVEHYTTMNLTKDTDRGIAIAGIVEIFQPYFDEHWFGMWRIFMPLELLWKTSGSVCVPSTVRAPTWSWLSVEGQVLYSNCLFEYGRDTLFTEFVDAGAIEESAMQLRLSTRLLHATCSNAEPGKRAFLTSVQGETRRMHYRGIPTILDHFGVIWFDHESKIPPTADIFCMPVQIHKSYSAREMRGLVLGEVGQGLYERLGYFTGDGKVLRPFIEKMSLEEIIIV